MGTAPKMNRQTKLNPAVQAKMVEYLKIGGYFETACGLVGIEPNTGYTWLQRGKRQGPTNAIYRSFRDAIASGIAEGEQYLHLKSLSGGKGSMQALWLLERRHPKRWSQRIRLQVDSELEDGIKYLKGALPPEVYVQVVHALAAWNAEDAAAGAPGLPEPPRPKLIKAAVVVPDEEK